MKRSTINKLAIAVIMFSFAYPMFHYTLVGAIEVIEDVRSLRSR